MELERFSSFSLLEQLTFSCATVENLNLDKFSGKLISLRLERCTNMTNQNFGSLARLKSLESLVLFGVTNVSSEGYKIFSDNSQFCKLRELEIEGDITVEKLEHITRLKWLKKLKLENRNSIFVPGFGGKSALDCSSIANLTNLESLI
ncbi:MAG: hypothetical protein HRK26_00410 [Rickettsiaceae bacterium H1]|nr:hypothetical protein [Rickettsiaceae bacterium H1]